MRVPCRVLFVSSLPHDSGGALLVHGLTHQASRLDLDIVGANIYGDLGDDGERDEQAQLLRCARDPEIVGGIFLLLGKKKNREALNSLLATRKPLVLLGREMPGDMSEGIRDLVTPDDFESAHQVVGHLIERGHRSIAHVTSHEDVSTVRDRRAGYESALQSSGLPVRPELVVTHGNDSLGRITFGPRRLNELVMLPTPPTAVFAVNDWVATQLLLTAHLAGIRVPEQLAIAGFDCLSDFRAGRPILTSAAQPFEKMGRYAARLVHERLRRQVPHADRGVYLEAPLRVYASSVVPDGGENANHTLKHDGIWRTRLVYEYIRRNVASDLTLRALATLVGVSSRTLLDDFHQHERISPMHALLEERLKRIRRDLTQPARETTVAQVVSHWGVRHLGRLSKRYAEVYGELPSETLRRSRE